MFFSVYIYVTFSVLPLVVPMDDSYPISYECPVPSQNTPRQALHCSRSQVDWVISSAWLISFLYRPDPPSNFQTPQIIC